MSHRQSLWWFLPLVATVVSPQGATADTLHVPENYSTIQRGINAATPGDVVLVAPGVYFETIVMKPEISLVGSGFESTIIDGEGFGNLFGSVVRGAENSLISNFTIRNANLAQFNNFGAGIHARFPMTIRENWITNCRVGILAPGPSIIERNVIIDNPTLVGISARRGTLIRNNTILNNGHMNAFGSGNGGIQVGDGAAPSIVNNIVMGNACCGINNFGPGDVRVAFNDVFANVSNYRRLPDLTGMDGNVSIEPRFVDPAAGDFRLRTDSPLIDAGDPSSPPDPDGTVADIGALAVEEDLDGDGVGESWDLCPDTLIPERTATSGLGINRWALFDADQVFDTNPPDGRGLHRAYDTAQTGGCSCEQLVERLHLGGDHVRQGCSDGIMAHWTRLVANQRSP